MAADIEYEEKAHSKVETRKDPVVMVGVVNPAYVQHSEEKEESPPPPPIQKQQTPHSQQSSQQRPKSAKPGSSKSSNGGGGSRSSKVSGSVGVVDEENESSNGRPKSGKKVLGAPTTEDSVESKKTKKSRPLTALDKWSDKEQVQNMNKLVAWDRPEDEI